MTPSLHILYHSPSALRHDYETYLRHGGTYARVEGADSLAPLTRILIRLTLVGAGETVVQARVTVASADILCAEFFPEDRQALEKWAEARMANVPADPSAGRTVRLEVVPDLEPRSSKYQGEAERCYTQSFPSSPHPPEQGPEACIHSPSEPSFGSDPYQTGPRSRGSSPSPSEPSSGSEPYQTGPRSRGSSPSPSEPSSGSEPYSPSPSSSPNSHSIPSSSVEGSNGPGSPSASRERERSSFAQPSLGLPLARRIELMSVAEKIHLARYGDREARALLSRDRAGVVQCALVSNPRMGLDEATTLARNPQLAPECAEALAHHPVFGRSPEVAFALCKNPRTPLRLISQLLSYLNVNDLRALAKGTNIRVQVAQAARKRLFGL